MTEHLAIAAIYRQDAAEGVSSCTILAVEGGPKPYARIWDEALDPITGVPRLEWGWSLHPSARKVWP